MTPQYKLYHYAECLVCFIVMLNVIMLSVVNLCVMLSVVMLSVVMLSVVMLNGIMLSVRAQKSVFRYSPVY